MRMIVEDFAAESNAQMVGLDLPFAPCLIPVLRLDVTRHESLKDYFSQFGEVVECTVMRDGATGRSRGFGFLTFRDPKTVNIVMVKEHYLDGKIIDPKRAIPRDEQERTSKIFVGGVSQEATEQDFKEYFTQFGRVVDATLMMDKDTGRPRGFGFVTFDSEAAVENTLDRPLEIHGKPIEVKKAQPRGNVRDDDDRGDRKFNRRGRDEKGGREGDRQGGAGDVSSQGQNQQNSQGMYGSGMTPQMMAQYWQRMQQYFAMMQQQMAASVTQGRGGMGGPMGMSGMDGMGAGGMNPAMMQQQMQAMQGMGRGQGMSGSQSPGAQSPGPQNLQGMQNMSGMNPAMMQQMQQMRQMQMQQMQMQQQQKQGQQSPGDFGGSPGPAAMGYGGNQGMGGGGMNGFNGGSAGGGAGGGAAAAAAASVAGAAAQHPGYNAQEQLMFEQRKYEQQQARRAREQQSYGQYGQGGPTSWEGMYDDVPQPHIPQGPAAGVRGIPTQPGGGFGRQMSPGQAGRGAGAGGRGSQGSMTPQPQSAPPANAPTGPKNAGKPGANYRGGGRGGHRGFHPYSRG
ncbi:MAG: hypothetical protein M1819_000988 [Sarea resinae]|nr:MAG: hypothetical protein M1819_000988 [Sarea resinae]